MANAPPNVSPPSSPQRPAKIGRHHPHHERFQTRPLEIPPPSHHQHLNSSSHSPRNHQLHERPIHGLTQPPPHDLGDLEVISLPSPSPPSAAVLGSTSATVLSSYPLPPPVPVHPWTVPLLQAPTSPSRARLGASPLISPKSVHPFPCRAPTKKPSSAPKAEGGFNQIRTTSSATILRSGR